MSDGNYRINDTTKWGMLALALLFDGIQLITPGIMDTMITAFAFMVFGMLFIEKGALTSSGKFRILIPFAEILIGNLPGITLEVWILIKISRVADKTLPEVVHKLWGLKRMRGDAKYVHGDWKTVKHEAGQIKKYAKGRGKRAYGKGRRGVETLARKTGQHAKIVRGTAKRSVASARRRMSSAKLTQ